MVEAHNVAAQYQGSALSQVLRGLDTHEARPLIEPIKCVRRYT